MEVLVPKYLLQGCGAASQHNLQLLVPQQDIYTYVRTSVVLDPIHIHDPIPPPLNRLLIYVCTISQY